KVSSSDIASRDFKTNYVELRKTRPRVRWSKRHRLIKERLCKEFICLFDYNFTTLAHFILILVNTTKVLFIKSAYETHTMQ
ncbi:hypothetical protein NQ315_012076, partial [Exocentrus adspersus]